MTSTFISKTPSKNQEQKAKDGGILRRVKKMGRIFMILFVILSLGYISLRMVNYRSVKGTFEWKSSNAQPFLTVNAPTDFDLGYLEGQALSKQIYRLKLILMLAAPKYNLNYESLMNEALQYQSFIPANQQQEMRGMALGASNNLGIPFSYDDILLQNCWLDIIYGRVFPLQSSPLACTAIGVQNSNGSITLGQNFDFTASFLPTLSFVLHQKANGLKIFSLRFGGSLALPIGKSEKITSLVTVVRSNIQADYMIPITCRTRLAYEHANSTNDWYNLFYTQIHVNHSLSFNTIFSDHTSIIGMEVNPQSTLFYNQSRIVKTNTYTHSSWQTLLYDTQYSKDRQQLAETLMNEYTDDGALTESELLNILENTPIIRRTAQNGTDTGTLAYFSSQYFGLGSISHEELGLVPV